ncbi:hypothetical protein KAT92_04960, partial [Candidatus Babeliales bacterium]|nr:hypothetical protein [Candidatus Babeliales bacterium]
KAMKDAKIFTWSITLLAALLFLPACAKNARKKPAQKAESSLWQKLITTKGTAKTVKQKRLTRLKNSRKKIGIRPKTFWGNRPKKTQSPSSDHRHTFFM